jgi:glyoxylase-like metal-dependent hydrolase (beta-lactamase superfamily II)
MKIQGFICNPFQENAYLVYDEANGDAVMIDPGFYDEAEFLKADRFVKENGLTVRRVLNTHLHLDHCMGNGWVLRKWNLEAEASEKDLFLIQQADYQAQMFGLALNETLPLPKTFLQEGDLISVGNIQLKVIEVPGHSRGGLAFYEERESVLFVGDTLFRGSYGRTDLPGGDTEQLFDSIRKKLLILPGDTLVLSGHGPVTTIGNEKLQFELQY